LRLETAPSISAHSPERLSDWTTFEPDSRRGAALCQAGAAPNGWLGVGIFPFAIRNPPEFSLFVCIACFPFQCLPVRSKPPNSIRALRLAAQPDEFRASAGSQRTGASRHDRSAGSMGAERSRSEDFWARGGQARFRGGAVLAKTTLDAACFKAVMSALSDSPPLDSPILPNPLLSRPIALPAFLVFARLPRGWHIRGNGMSSRIRLFFCPFFIRPSLQASRAALEAARLSQLNPIVRPAI